jgi:hypothetical protein
MIKREDRGDAPCLDRSVTLINAGRFRESHTNCDLACIGVLCCCKSVLKPAEVPEKPEVENGKASYGEDIPCSSVNKQFSNTSKYEISDLIEWEFYVRPMIKLKVVVFYRPKP